MTPREITTLLELVVGGLVATSGFTRAADFHRYECPSSAALLPVGYLYFVELERSRFRTLGFRLAGLEIVSLNGTRPTRVDMMVMLMMAWLGPLNLLLDFLWIPGDNNRQALRDKFAGTYVIKHRTQPAGWDTIRYVRYFFLGLNWSFPEVARGGKDARIR